MRSLISNAYAQKLPYKCHASDLLSLLPSIQYCKETEGHTISPLKSRYKKLDAQRSKGDSNFVQHVLV